MVKQLLLGEYPCYIFDDNEADDEKSDNEKSDNEQSPKSHGCRK